jgi:uncharacterized membrane protein
MLELKPHHTDTIKAAIDEVQLHTTAEIHVYVTRDASLNPLTDATAQFHRMKLDRTAHRNSVLLFVAPRSKTFALYGDAGIHHQIKHAEWERIIDEMKPLFRTGDLAAAITHGVREVGAALAAHFPRR